MKKPLAILTLVLTVYFGLQTPNAHSQIITTVAGNGTAGFSGDGGLATVAKLNSPSGVSFDASGNLYIADIYNDRIRMVNTSGSITTVAGSAIGGYSGDGGQATAAELSRPTYVVIDASGNLYIDDYLNDVIRKVNTSGIITTIAGMAGVAAYGGDGGPATSAQLNHAQKITLDASGNLYIADLTNNRIRKVNTSGIITTIAGNGAGSYSGDGGQAIAAGIPSPNGIAFDATGNLYVADGSSRIRKINTSGIITTVAGNGTAGFSGDNGPATSAEISIVSGIVFDAVGNMYTADVSNNRIRKVNASGIITTIIGNGVAGYSGDGGMAVSAELNSPDGLAFDPSGNLYIADYGNNRIRMVTNVGTMSVNQTTDKIEQISVWPNPASNSIQLAFAGNNGQTMQLQITDVLGNMVKQQDTTTEKTNIDISDLQEGVYFIRTNATKGILEKKIVVQR